MRIAGHQHVFILVALLYQLVKENLDGIHHFLEFMTGEQFQVDKHLVVTGTSAVYFLAHVAQFPGEHQLHLRMYVLHAVLYHELSTLASGIDILEFGE